MKIKTVKDAVEASNKILEDLVAHQKLTAFNLMVDHGEGTISNCAWTPTSTLADKKNFLAVEDYVKTIVLLLTHPRIKDIEYDEKNHAVTAVFTAPEMEEVDRLEHPDLGYSEDQY
jgi:hypothetical protein